MNPIPYNFVSLKTCQKAVLFTGWPYESFNNTLFIKTKMVIACRQFYTILIEIKCNNLIKKCVCGRIFRALWVLIHVNEYLG